MNPRPETTDFYDPDANRPPVRFRKMLLEGTQELLRTNYFAICRVLSGQGEAAIDESRMAFSPTTLLFVLPYQYVRLSAQEAAEIEVVEFHANFLCVETFHTEVGCAGRLFNDPYGLPVLCPDEAGDRGVHDLFRQLEKELDEGELAYREAALALVKLLLIRLTRLKDAPDPAHGDAPKEPHRHPTLVRLEALIESHYCTWHSPSDYARALRLSVKTLGRLVREHLGTTTKELIRRRILIHAKWHLLHTLKPVKEVASELGFNDVLYFSRLFRKSTGVSPTYFREFETTIRRGSNLSITLGATSIAQEPVQG